MRIAIDARMAQHGRVGIGVYVDGLVRALAARFAEDEFCLITSRELPSLEHLVAPNVRIFPVAPTYQQYVARDWWEQAELGAFLDRNQADVYHSPNYTLPFVRKPRCATVVTLFDASLFEVPSVYRASHAVRVRQLIRRACRNADAAIFGSQHAARAFERILGDALPQTRRAIYIGVPVEFDAEPPKDDIVARVRARFGVALPYAIAVGSVQPRKNYVRLLRALTKPGLEACSLVLAGAIAWKSDDIRELIRRLALESRVIITGFVTTEELRALVRGATMMAFPSLYEGFGIPPLEAFALGVPVCASSATSIPEVVGDAAVMFDPNCVDDIANAMSKLLHDGDLRRSLRVRGYARLRNFSWEQCADEHMQVYRRAAASRPGRLQ